MLIYIVRKPLDNRRVWICDDIRVHGYLRGQGHSETDVFGYASYFNIFVQTRSIAILNHRVHLMSFEKKHLV
jgi:hypothetical protein